MRRRVPKLWWRLPPNLDGLYFPLDVVEQRVTRGRGMILMVSKLDLAGTLNDTRTAVLLLDEYPDDLRIARSNWGSCPPRSPESKVPHCFRSPFVAGVITERSPA